MSDETPQLAKHKSIRDALQYVVDHPVLLTDEVDTPTWELIGRTLFALANNPNSKVRGATAKATRAQKIISNRLVGLRRAGTHPAQAKETQISFVDLTAGAIDS